MSSSSKRGRRQLAAVLLAVLCSGLASAPAPASSRPAAPATAAAGQPEGVVLGTGAPGALPGRYIVVLRRDRVASHAAGAVARALAGAGVSRVYGSVLGFSARLSAQAARRLAGNPAVAVVEQDRVVRLSATQQNPTWGLDRLDERSRPLSRSYRPTNSAAGVHAYVIDTGIRITHGDFGGRASYGYDFVGGDRHASDCNGHGTHVAGTIGGTRYGVAKKVRLVAVRVLDCDGSGFLSDIIDGVDWVTEHAVKPAVANMSLGGSYSFVMDQAVERSIASGVTYTVAAGNEGQNAYYTSPAGLPAAITVGATDGTDRRAAFSNYGRSLDLFAPGVRITSAASRSNTATATYSGTSMAAPHVAGAAAMVLAMHRSWTPRQVRTQLVAQSTTGIVGNRGSGSPNRLLRTAAPPAAPTISTRTVAAAVVGRAYRVQLALGSARQGSWKVSGGRLPAGLKLSATGVISGTPTTTGVWRCTVRFTDVVPQSATRDLTVTVKPAPPVIVTTVLPAAVSGTAYAEQLAVQDGRPGSWTIAAGQLPAGLTMSAAGQITGVPTADGAATLSVRFTDLAGATTTRSLTLTVHPVPPVISATSLIGRTGWAAVRPAADQPHR